MHTLPGSIVTKSVQHRTCQRAVGIVQRRPVGRRFAAANQITKEYCYVMRDFFEWVLTQKNAGPPLHGEAASVTDINNMDKDGRTSCCAPHQGASCHDEKIAQCVCNKSHAGRGKHHDDFCCTVRTASKREWRVQSCTLPAEHGGLDKREPSDRSGENLNTIRSLRNIPSRRLFAGLFSASSSSWNRRLHECPSPSSGPLI